MWNKIRKFLGIPTHEVKPPESPKHIDITKGCCQRCIENGGFHCKDSEICLIIGYTTIYLCKEHFCEAIKVLNDFYEKNKDELEQKIDGGADND
jgi:hypothetical protein